MARLVTRAGLPARLVALAGLAALVVTPALFPAPRVLGGTPTRTVAVGDVHGDYEQLVRILQHGGLLDERLAWSGGEASLVLVGDLIDRGARSREVLDLVMRLQSEAPRNIRVLLGNHEALNLMGDLRYVAPEEYASYAGSGSEKRREVRYESYRVFLRERARRLGFEESVLSEAERRTWMAAHPAGFFERREAFRPDGRYGHWLRELDAALLQDGVVFVHGGLGEARLFPSVEAINGQVRRELSAVDALWSSLSEAGLLWPDLTWGEALGLLGEELDLWSAVDSLPADQVDPAARERRPDDKTLERMRELLDHGSWAIASPEGPLWYRGLANRPEVELAPQLERTLRHYDAEQIVFGHTPAEDSRIHARLGGKAFAIDTGISAAVGGRASALEIRDGRFSALYPGEESVLLWEPGGPGERKAAAGERKPTAAREGGYDAFYGLTAERIEAFLRSAPIVEVRKIATGITKPSRATLDDGKLRHDVAIQTVDACEEVTEPRTRTRQRVCDSYKYNLAAYELGKLLGLTSIPPCVEREFNGRKATFVWWIDETMTFADMNQRELHPPDGASWNRQQWVVGLFDELIYNTDRNQGNLLVDPTWRIWLIDHTRAFRSDRRMRNPAMLSKMRIDRPLLAALGELTPESLQSCCADYLTAEERKGVLARRDSIVAHFR